MSRAASRGLDLAARESRSFSRFSRPYFRVPACVSWDIAGPPTEWEQCRSEWQLETDRLKSKISQLEADIADLSEVHWVFSAPLISLDTHSLTHQHHVHKFEFKRGIPL